MSASGAFTQYVLKVATRCDLACDHCYVFEAADKSWREKPRFSAEDTLVRTAERIAEHASAHGLPSVQVVLHGGEPLLAGKDRLRFAAEELHAALNSVGVGLDLRIHSNGVRLDREFCDLFRKYSVKIGISLDGPKTANDLHRRFANGASSHHHVMSAVELLRGEYRDIYSGILCTVDLRNDPVAVYDAVKAAAPPRADFLLPHATHSAPPLRLGEGGAEYGHWLLAVFDRWNTEDRMFEIRTFDSILAALRGLPSGTEALGLDPVDLVVVEADGTLEQVDSLKVVYSGAPYTGFNVFENTFDEVAGHTGFAARRGGLADLCQTCRQCRFVGVCGGGLRTHRYRALGHGSESADAGKTDAGSAGIVSPASEHDLFNNPSVYCDDLKVLITEIKARSRTATVAESSKQAGPSLPENVLDEIAHGFGGRTAVEHLTRCETWSRRVLLAKFFVASSGVCGPLQESVDHAIGVLKRLDATAPQAVRETLAHPYFRVWAANWIEAAEASTLNSTDCGHIAAIAAAAAIRAGASAELDVPVVDGAVHLPTFGRLIVGTDVAQDKRGVVTVRVEDGVCLIMDAPTWQGVRSVSMPDFAAGQITVEDTDPYRRHCHKWEVTGRLDEDEASAWLRTIPSAWELIGRDHSVYAPGIATGLATIVPIGLSASRNDVSSTARHAFGSIGAGLPVPRFGRDEPDAAALALLFIHEFQHGKLGVVMEQVDLHDLSDRRRFHAPWRLDPRPLDGLLQGTYAHVGVTDFWRMRRLTAPGREERDHANAEFETWLGHTVKSVEVLAESGSLTATGLRFTDAMRETLEPWLSESSLTSAKI
jgi:uncharacterized protein